MILVTATAMPLMASCSCTSPSFRSRPAISICMLLRGCGRLPLVIACAAVWAAPTSAPAGLDGTAVTGEVPPTRLLKLNWPCLSRITRALKPLMATWSTTKLLDSKGHTATARRVLSMEAKVSALSGSDSDTPCTDRPMRGKSDSSISPSIVSVR
ncbi:hypothetical protein D9M68_654700 [compost metagenome]